MSEDETAVRTGTALMGHLDPIFLERPNDIDRRTLLTTLALLPALSAPLPSSKIRVVAKVAVVSDHSERLAALH